MKEILTDTRFQGFALKADFAAGIKFLFPGRK
jgi:hypothetical protein